MKKLNFANFDEALKKDGRLKVVDFYATWCGPCGKFLPIFESVANEDHEGVDFFTLEVDGENQNMTKLYNVISIPTVLFFRDGEEIFRTGMLTESELREHVNP